MIKISDRARALGIMAKIQGKDRVAKCLRTVDTAKLGRKEAMVYTSKESTEIAEEEVDGMGFKRRAQSTYMPEEDYDGNLEDDYLPCGHIYELRYSLSFQKQCQIDAFFRTLSGT